MLSLTGGGLHHGKEPEILLDRGHLGEVLSRKNLGGMLTVYLLCLQAWRGGSDRLAVGLKTWIGGSDRGPVYLVA